MKKDGKHTLDFMKNRVCSYTHQYFWITLYFS